MENKISNTIDAFFKVKLNKQFNKITSAMEFTNKTVLQNCKLHIQSTSCYIESIYKLWKLLTYDVFVLNDASFYHLKQNDIIALLAIIQIDIVIIGASSF